MIRAAKEAARLALAAWLGLGVAGCGALVGEQCAPGYELEGEQCVRSTVIHICASGEVTVLGMDFSGVAPGTPEAQLLGNAVFSADSDPLQILDYRALAEWNASSVTNVIDLIASEAVERERMLQTTVARDADDFVERLASGEHQLIFIHDQPAAPAGALAELGATWAPALEAFEKKCGTTVVLATTGGTGEMDAFLRTSGALPVTAMSEVDPSTIKSVAKGDPLSDGVKPPFKQEQRAASFTLDPTATNPGVTVVAAPDGAPVAIRRRW